MNYLSGPAADPPLSARLSSPGVSGPVHGVDFSQVALERLPELELDAAHRGRAPC